MKYLNLFLTGLSLLLLLTAIDKTKEANYWKVEYAKEDKIEANVYRNYYDELNAHGECEQRVKNTDTLENILQECNTGLMDARARLLETTGLLESVARCSFFKLQPEHCVGNVDLKAFIKDNRTGNF